MTTEPDRPTTDPACVLTERVGGSVRKSVELRWFALPDWLTTLHRDGQTIATGHQPLEIPSAAPSSYHAWMYHPFGHHLPAR